MTCKSIIQQLFVLNMQIGREKTRSSFYVAYLTTLSGMELCKIDGGMNNECGEAGTMKTGRGTEVVAENPPQ